MPAFGGAFLRANGKKNSHEPIPLEVSVPIAYIWNQNYFTMPFDQYHEPPGELPEETRTFARMIASVIEEAEAIGWYEQRIAVEKDKEAKKVMQHAQQEEFIHFAMDLEFLLRKKRKWNTIMKNVLFKPGDIVDNAEHAEQEVE